jgi:hypothetical protein
MLQNKRRWVIGSVLLLGYMAGHSQPNINRVEYYLDIDPGRGLATNIPITPAKDINHINVSVPVGTLGQGVHIMGVRSQDANGTWSLDNSWIFLKPYTSLAAGLIPPITKLEYYFDTDPGLGLATNIPLTASTNIANLMATLTVPALNDSTHTLYVRSQDANGAWSLDNAFSFTYTGILPITFLRFTAALTPQENTLLQWSTSFEQNSSYYNILRTSDGLHFSKIGTVQAAGNSSVTTDYTYTDSTAASLGYPTVFYRLEEVDLDGKTNYSQVASVNLSQPFKISVSPNPIQRQQINTTLEDAKAEMAAISITDMSGRVLQTSQASLQRGTNFIRIDGGLLGAGIYFLTVRTASHSVTIPFMKE